MSKTKIYITGDIHGDPFRLSSKKFPEGKELTKNDFVIVTGDFGILWKNVPDREEDYKLRWLENKPWTTLFVDGNHENFSRLLDLPVRREFGGKVGVVRTGIFHLKRGEIYHIGDNSFFCFGGAMSTDQYQRTIGISYWQEEIASFAEMDYGLSQLEKHQWSVDYIITHTVPNFLFSSILGKNIANKIDCKDPTRKYLDHIANSANFKKWFFGHFHIDKSIDNYESLFESIDEIL